MTVKFSDTFTFTLKGTAQGKPFELELHSRAGIGRHPQQRPIPSFFHIMGKIDPMSDEDWYRMILGLSEPAGTA